MNPDNDCAGAKHDVPIGPWVWLASVLMLLVVALPALLIGLGLARLSRERKWSLPLWLGLAALAFGFTVLVTRAAFEQLLAAQLAELIRMVKMHQVDLLAWDGARLWATTWPVWLHTLVLVPAVAAWYTLSTRGLGLGAAALSTHERQRQRAVTRARSQASHRLHHRRRLPDAVDRQMVMGVPIDDANA